MRLRLTSIIGLLICVLLLGGSVLAQPQVAQRAGLQPVRSDVDLAAQPQVGAEAELQPISTETLQSSALSAEFSRLRSSDNEIAAANTFLANKGFSAQTSQNSFWGQRAVYRSTSGGQQADETYTIQVQDYSKQGSKDLGAVARVTVVSGGQSQVYSFALIAPNGNFDSAEEYQVVRGKGPAAAARSNFDVVKANSWWSCVKGQMRQKCASTCVNSLVTCPMTSWTAYLSCVAVRCGGCFLKASACCGCDCSWWCKWAVGCCDR